MATPVEMPKLGNTVEECILVQWKKVKGDKVSSGEVIAEIETDKATFEVTAPVDGTFLEAFFDEGALVPVFTNICVIGSPGEDPGPFRAAQPVSKIPEAPRSAPVAVAPAQASPETFLSPRARRFAEQHRFYPPAVSGSGPGGRVLEQDLRNLYHASSIRDKIARRMRESMATTAQYTMHTSADATGLLALRRRIKAAGQTREGPDVNINEMVMFATVKALLRMPELNAEMIDGKIYRRQEIHLGFACDTERGLLVPVVSHCEKLSLEQLSVQVKELTARALDGTIGPDALTGATFTVSNLGNLGIQSFTPILNPPQVAILGVDSIELKPVRRGERVEFVEHLGLSLTCDHQAIDGAPGARFLQILREQIESMESIADLKL
jgi:pyruvate dehydrogenase E2 component (dihydrolipoamide acetyltransferase)